MTQTMDIIKKHIILATLAIWATASFFILCSESDMSLGAFIATKGAAVLSMYACFRATAKAEKSHKLPDYWYSSKSEETEL